MMEELDVTELLRFIRERNEQNPAHKLTLFHCVVTALAKTIKLRPKLNYFISGNRLFERDKLLFGFVAKRQFTDHSEESVMVLNCKDEMVLDDISHKIVGDVKDARTDSKDRNNPADDAMKILMKLPRFLVKTFVWWQNWSDYHRWYPESLMKVDFNFCSVLLSNLGSIGCDACYHHLNNFGTNSIVVTIGKTHQKTVVQPDGSVETRDMCNFAFTIDERIADGFYFARSIRLFDRIIQHPELLDAPIKEDLPDELR